MGKKYYYIYLRHYFKMIILVGDLVEDILVHQRETPLLERFPSIGGRVFLRVDHPRCY